MPMKHEHTDDSLLVGLLATVCSIRVEHIHAQLTLPCWARSFGTVNVSLFRVL